MLKYHSYIIYNTFVAVLSIYEYNWNKKIIIWNSRSIRLTYQDKIYKLCQEVRKALDLVVRHVGPILSVFTFVVTFLYPWPLIVDYIDQNDHIVDHIDEHDELKPQLPAIIPPIAMNGHDVFVPKSEQDAVRSSHSKDTR